MPPKQRELKKNYIGIVSDRTDEQRAVDSVAKSDRLTKKYLLGLMAAVLRRVADARKWSTRMRPCGPSAHRTPGCISELPGGSGA